MYCLHIIDRYLIVVLFFYAYISFLDTSSVLFREGKSGHDFIDFCKCLLKIWNAIFTYSCGCSILLIQNITKYIPDQDDPRPRLVET